MSETNETETKPWVAAGVSKATWYRNRKDDPEAAHVSVAGLRKAHNEIAGLQAELEAAHAEIAMLKRQLAEKPKAATPPIGGNYAPAGAPAAGWGLVSQSTVKLMTMLEMRQMRQAEMLKTK